MTTPDPTLTDFLPRGGDDDGFVATAGEDLPEGMPAAVEAVVIEAVKTVYDPEIPVNLYDLGLIYRLDIDPRGNVDIDMTLTAPACPVAGEMPGQVADTVAAVDGVGTVTVRLVWDPPWSRDRMSEDARLALDLF
ncbi:MAG: SUF system Fe-S cluster assembly protein [Rhodospirillales bacterium]|nr:MAG: SUF system Fe-S cluster assembly protein [Rhodospirillales bacterium]